MGTQTNVFYRILNTTQTMNQTLVVIAECLAICAEKLNSIEAMTLDTAEVEAQLEKQQKETEKTLAEIQKTLAALTKKK